MYATNEETWGITIVLSLAAVGGVFAWYRSRRRSDLVQAISFAVAALGFIGVAHAALHDWHTVTVAVIGVAMVIPALAVNVVVGLVVAFRAWRHPKPLDPLAKTPIDLTALQADCLSLPAEELRRRLREQLRQQSEANGREGGRRIAPVMGALFCTWSLVMLLTMGGRESVLGLDHSTTVWLYALAAVVTAAGFALLARIIIAVRRKWQPLIRATSAALKSLQRESGD